MSTRTTGKRETLEERVREREKKHKSFHLAPSIHIRAEYEGLARQVRKLKENRSHMQCDYTWALNDVLAIIERLKQ